MRRRSTTRASITEAWKRRLVYISTCLLIVNLIGVLMLAVQFIKLQWRIHNQATYIGFSMFFGGILPMHFIIGYTIAKHGQYPTGQVLMMGNALYVMIGTTLLCVAFVVPADLMYDMITFKRWNREERPLPVQNETLIGNFTDRLYSDSRIDQEYIIREIGKEKTAVWNEDLIILIQTRLGTLGGGILATGIVSASTTLWAIYRIQRVAGRSVSIKQSQRRGLNPRGTGRRQRLKSSVYDYAGWENRTTDIFQERQEAKKSIPSSMRMMRNLPSISLIAAVHDNELLTEDDDAGLQEECEELRQQGSSNCINDARGGCQNTMIESISSRERIGESSCEMEVLNCDDGPQDIIYIKNRIETTQT